jgi:hypothetical protein
LASKLSGKSPFKPLQVDRLMFCYNIVTEGM